MGRLTRDGTTELVSRDQGNIDFPCSADHEQDWQPYPFYPYSAICDDHTYIHAYIHTVHFHKRYAGAPKQRQKYTLNESTSQLCNGILGLV